MEFYLGQIIMFGGNFAIRGFAFAQGQLLPISQYSALFSILGTIYGGDGRTTFALPDLRGRTPIGAGSGPGLPSYREGQKGGSPTTTLLTQNLPPHHHSLMNVPVSGTVSIATSEEEGNSQEPGGNHLALAVDANGNEINPYYSGGGGDSLAGGTLVNGTVNGMTSNTGQQIAFNNMQPYLTINYEVCLQGIFPSRS